MTQQFCVTNSAPRSGTNKALWLIGIGLLLNAGVLLLRGQGAPDIVLDRAAMAQVQPTGGAGPGGLSGQPLGARGIFMMPAQLGPTTFGLYLMDVDSGTISVYRSNPDGNGRRFALMAARSFKYDRFLEDFNNDSPRPKDVQKLVEDQAQRIGLQGKDNAATVDQHPKPDENKPDLPATAPAVGG